VIRARFQSTRGKWKDDFSDGLRGRTVVILPDNDSVGRKHAKQVAQSLSGRVKSVKILKLPGLPLHGDASTCHFENQEVTGHTRKPFRPSVPNCGRNVGTE
jgi:hypothetical protein